MPQLRRHNRWPCQSFRAMHPTTYDAASPLSSRSPSQVIAIIVAVALFYAGSSSSRLHSSTTVTCFNSAFSQNSLISSVGLTEVLFISRSDFSLPFSDICLVYFRFLNLCHFLTLFCLSSFLFWGQSLAQ